MSDMEAKNTDRELWRGPDEGGGSFYADSIHITEGDGIGINCGGHVFVRPLRDWHAMPARIEALEAALMTEWAARDNRIEALEFELKAAKSEIEIADSVIEQTHARIEALEAALREIGDPLMPHRVDGVGRAWEQATIQTMQKIARAALAPEQDKP